jgi:hypothetical protein
MLVVDIEDLTRGNNKEFNPERKSFGFEEQREEIFTKILGDIRNEK